MLRFFFDKPFIDGLNFSAFSEKPYLQDFFETFIRKFKGQVQVIIEGDFNDEMTKKSIKDSPILEALISFNPSNTLFEPNFERLFTELPKGYFGSILFSGRSEAYFVERDYGIPYFSLNNLKELWPIYKPDVGQDLLIRSNIPNDCTGYFTGWPFFNKFRKKVFKMILVDKYIINNKDRQRISYNLKPLIENLTNTSKTISQKVIIIALHLPKNFRRNDESNWFEDQFSALIEEFKIPDRNLAYNFIRYDKGKNYRNDSIHNRFILTNLLFIETRAGFNIYDEKGGINSADILTVKSIFKTSNYRLFVDHYNQCLNYFTGLKYSDIAVLPGGKKVPCINYYPENLVI
jgi:hypothetical protein